MLVVRRVMRWRIAERFEFFMVGWECRPEPRIPGVFKLPSKLVVLALDFVKRGNGRPAMTGSTDRQC